MSVILYKNHISLANLDNEIHERLANNQSNSFIYIVPTRRKVRELQREFIKIIPGATSPAFNLFTLETFAIKLHQIYCKPKLILTPTTQAVVFTQLIKKNENELKYFFPHGITHNIPNGTLQKIISVVNNLKVSGVFISALYEEVESGETDEKQKLKDILLIYSEYEAFLSDQFIDAGGIFKDINSVLTDESCSELFMKQFPDVNAIFVAGFDEFSDPEITMINAVSKFRDVGWIISFDYFLHNDELFGHLRENFDKFSSLGFKPAPEPAKHENSFRSHIAANLFANRKATQQNISCDNITILRPPNREK
jgi:ATP-dependent helicase/DNAse subunit B